VEGIYVVFLKKLYQKKRFDPASCNPASGQKIMANGMAKSGTHLVKKALSLMGYKMNVFCLAANQAQRAAILWDEKNADVLGEGILLGAERPTPIHELLLKQLLRSLPSNQAINGHNLWSDGLERVLLAENVPVICILRDPRDVAVSLANYLDKHRHPEFAGKSRDEQIMLAIEGVAPASEPLVTPANILGINESCFEMHKWIGRPNVLAVRYEELIGPEGGGELDKQLQLLEDIARFVGREINNIQSLRDNVFGQTRTFHSGQSGQWQESFQSEHKNRFKEVGGAGLVHLGYESDENW
jgi:hypothetical protein